MNRSYFRSANLLGLSLAIAPAGTANANVVDDKKVVAIIDHAAPAKVDEMQRSANLQRPQQHLRELATRPLYEKIASLRGLRENWDGPGSVAPSESAVSGALRFVSSLSPASPLPEISPAGDGEISLSWRDSSKFIDVSFFGETASAYTRVDGVVKKVRSLRQFYELPSDAIEALIGV